VAETVLSLSERKGWTATETVATFEPAPGGWVAWVRSVRVASHSYQRWHIAVVDPVGVARYTTFANLLGEVARVAEGNVRARNMG